MNDIDNILAIEWEMFQKVNAGGPKAACQLMPEAFYAMRFGQFAAWPQDARDAYAHDLRTAKAAGRNLMAEKYIRMMEHTDPAGYRQLAADLPLPTERQHALADDINARLLRQTEALFRQYPLVSRSARPLYADGDSEYDTSIETYQRGELLTYSEATLTALLRHVSALEAQGISLVRRILENSIRYYGFDSLEQAEAACAEEVDE